MTHKQREANLDKAKRTLEAKLAALHRLSKSIALWQSRVRYYTEQLQLSDEERAAARAARAARKAEKARPKPTRRIITNLEK